MRIRLKTILLCLAAVFALSAVASASASATPLCNAGDEKDPAEYTVCVKNAEGGQKELESPSKLEGTSGESILESKVLGVKVKIVCKKDKFTDTPSVKDNQSTGTITFEECEVSEPKNCQLIASQKKEIPASFTNELGPTTGSATKVTFTGNKGTSGKEFAHVNLENKGAETCAIKGEYPITGNTGTGCTFDAAIETFKLEHELVCKKEGESLSLGGNAATFSSTANIKAKNETTKAFEEFAILES